MIGRFVCMNAGGRGWGVCAWTQQKGSACFVRRFWGVGLLLFTELQITILSSSEWCGNLLIEGHGRRSYFEKSTLLKH